VTWESSNKDVATVDKNGVVTGVGAGQVTITATSVSNPKLKDSKTINVDWQRGTLSAKATYDSSLPLPSSWSIDVYGKRDSETTQIGTLKAGILSIEKDALRAGNYELTWKQTGLDNFIVDVEPKTAAVERGKETPVTVTISKRSVEKITLSSSRDGSLNLGDTLTLKPIITPEHTTVQTIKWTSSNENVAKVDSNGNVTTQGTPGTAVIKAELDGKSATYTVTVDDEITVYGRALLLQRNFIEEDVPVDDASGITVTATVTLANSSTVTRTTTTKDTQGHFSFSDLPRGKVTFAFTKDDTSYGRDTFDYTEVTATQTPNKIMLLAINKSADEESKVTGFGFYHNVNTNSDWNGEWRVLDRVDNKALLVSSIILFEAPYSASEASWDTSDLKKSLNGDGFYSGLNKNTNKSIFTERAKQYMIGNEGDKVFLLSVDEVNGYFNDDSDRRVKTLDINTSGNPYKGWWLRRSEGTSTPPYVSENGYVHGSGSSSHGVGVEKYGVRPAIWVQL